MSPTDISKRVKHRIHQQSLMGIKELFLEGTILVRPSPKVWLMRGQVVMGNQTVSHKKAGLLIDTKILNIFIQKEVPQCPMGLTPMKECSTIANKSAKLLNSQLASAFTEHHLNCRNRMISRIVTSTMRIYWSILQWLHLRRNTLVNIF